MQRLEEHAANRGCFIAQSSKGMRYPADPPTVDEIVVVTRRTSDDRHGWRLQAMIVVLWRAGLRIQEALALTRWRSHLDRAVVAYHPRGLGRSVRKDGRVDNAPGLPRDALGRWGLVVLLARRYVSRRAFARLRPYDAITNAGCRLRSSGLTPRPPPTAPRSSV
jgi:hypothetical protein